MLTRAIKKLIFVSAILVTHFLLAMDDISSRDSAAAIKSRENGELMIKAARSGQIQRVREFLQQGVPASYKSDGESPGETLLHIFAAKGNTEVLAEMVIRGAELNAQDGQGKTPLYRAVESDHLETVEILSRCAKRDKVSINSETIDRMTSLRLALQHENISIAWVLLEAGAGIDLDDYPLIFLAVRRNRVDMMLKLIALGVPANLVEASTGKTALMIAIEHNAVYCVQELVKQSETINKRSLREGKTALHYAIQKVLIFEILTRAGADPNIEDNEGNGALHLAAREGCIPVVSILLQARAQLNNRNKEGDTALHIALRCSNELAAKVLISGGASTNIREKHGEAPIHIAARNGLLNAINAMILQRADVHVISDIKHWTALHYAADKGCDSVVRALLRAGAESVPSQQNTRNSSSVSTQPLPVFLAFASDHISTVLILLGEEKKLDVKKNALGWAWMFNRAVCKGRKEIVEKLLDLRIPINSASFSVGTMSDADNWKGSSDSVLLDDRIDPNNWTALHYAVWFGRAEITPLLLGKANVNAQNGNGQTALHFAISRGYVDIARMLLLAGAHLNGEEKSERALPFLLTSDCPHGNNHCVKMLKLLLEFGAKIESLKELNPFIISRRHECLLDIMRFQRLGKTLLLK